MCSACSALCQGSLHPLSTAGTWRAAVTAPHHTSPGNVTTECRLMRWSYSSKVLKQSGYQKRRFSKHSMHREMTVFLQWNSPSDSHEMPGTCWQSCSTCSHRTCVAGQVPWHIALRREVSCLRSKFASKCWKTMVIWGYFRYFRWW